MPDEACLHLVCSVKHITTFLLLGTLESTSGLCLGTMYTIKSQQKAQECEHVKKDTLQCESWNEQVDTGRPISWGGCVLDRQIWCYSAHVLNDHKWLEFCWLESANKSNGIVEFPNTESVNTENKLYLTLGQIWQESTTILLDGGLQNSITLNMALCYLEAKERSRAGLCDQSEVCETVITLQAVI